MEAVVNVPIEVDLKMTDGKTLRFAVRELSVRQRAEWLGKLKAIARREWSIRVAELARNLPDKDRLAFLKDSAKEDPDLESEIDKLRWDAESIGILLAYASQGKLDQKVLEGASSEASEEINRAVMKALGIEAKLGEEVPTQPTQESR